jgi:phytoene desaturase
VEAFKSIAENSGCQFLFNAAVKRIDVEDARAKGVTLEDGRRIEADVIVANADLPYVYLSLLPDSGLAARMKKKRYSCSTVSFFWGIDKVYAQLAPHNLFLSDDYKGNFDSIIKGLTIAETPSIYVHAPTRIDPSLAPAGQDSIVAIVPVGHLDEGSGQDWDEIRKRARQAVLDRIGQMGVHDLERHLKFEICVAPQDWQRRFNLVRGATHGLSHTRTQMFYFRPRNRHDRYRNLYFVGASTHPGTGIPCVLISARLAAERILQDRKAIG